MSNPDEVLDMEEVVEDERDDDAPRLSLLETTL
jgi:hypothetical protein